MSDLDMMSRTEDGLGTISAPMTVRIERLLPGPIERVWAYLTEADKRRRWLAGGEFGGAGAASELLFHNAELCREGDEPPAKYAGYSAPHAMRCAVGEWDPPRRLSLNWGGEGPDTSVVTFDLESVGSRVRLVLTHERLESREGLLSVSAGWHGHLAILTALLEGRDPPSFWSLHTELEKRYDPLIDAARP